MSCFICPQMPSTRSITCKGRQNVTFISPHMSSTFVDDVYPINPSLAARSPLCVTISIFLSMSSTRSMKSVEGHIYFLRLHTIDQVDYHCVAILFFFTRSLLCPAPLFFSSVFLHVQFSFSTLGNSFLFYMHYNKKNSMTICKR